MRLVAFCLLLALTGPTWAGQLAVVMPGGGLIYKKVESIRERKFANLVEQKTDFSCGAAALATILRQAYWMDVDEDHVIKGMLLNADQDLVRTQGYRITPEVLITVKVPVVVLLDIRGYKHFVVLQRADKDWVYIGDPVLGHKRYAKDDFIKGWNGIVFAVLGEGYDKANALLDPPTPLTAKKQLNEFSPVRDSELMDFGFISSDFF